MSKTNKETLWMGPQLENGNRPFVSRSGTGEPKVGVVGTQVEGADSVLELKHLEGPFYEVQSETRLTASGPAQVSSRAYRDGWSRLFGGKETVGRA
jgi:hypothetical protein